MIARIVEPEYLDELPHDHPDAVRSRGDLALINSIMGNHRWIANQVRKLWRPGWRILELGAGDGRLARSIITAGIVPANLYRAIDLGPQPVEWPHGAIWQQGNIFDSSVLKDVDIVIANLFLHHFDPDQLAILGDRIRSNARCMIASEPARRRAHELQGALLVGLADLNWITGHDMITSIRAGFHGDELAQHLGMDGWHNATSMTWHGAYRITSLKP